MTLENLTPASVNRSSQSWMLNTSKLMWFTRPAGASSWSGTTVNDDWIKCNCTLPNHSQNPLVAKRGRFSKRAPMIFW